MIGNGSGDKLKKLIAELHLEDCVSILGAKPHSEVFHGLIQSIFMCSLVLWKVCADRSLRQ